MLQRSDRIRQKRGPQARSVTPATRLGVVARNGPTEADIRRRAYEIYAHRAGAPGDALADWLLAELELQTEASRPPGRKQT